MSGHVDEGELPELSEEDIELLDLICKRASTYSEPPYKAIFAAYDEVLAEQNIEKEHDGVIFRVLMRVGDSTKKAQREHSPVDLVERLTTVLDNLGWTLLQTSEDGDDEATGPAINVSPARRKQTPYPRRRVSFDDARLEETWRSEYSEPASPAAPPVQTRLFSLPARRGKFDAPERRTRSASSQRRLPIRSAAPKHFQQSTTESISEPASEREGQFNPTLLFEPSQTQLEQNADAFIATSALRSTRQALQVWHGAAIELQEARKRAYTIAAHHDRRTLLRQALDQWRLTLDIKRQEQQRLNQLQRLEEKATHFRDLYILTKAFTHWATSTQDEALNTKVAKRLRLKMTYFRKWRAIASENQTKIRSIRTRKYVQIWREKTARRQLWQEQAVAHYEETLMRKCKAAWFWQFCSRRVEGWHDQWIERRALGRLRGLVESSWQREREADELYRSRLARRVFGVLHERLTERQRAVATAEQLRDRTDTTKALRNLQARTRLAPLARTMTLKVNLDLERKGLRIWHLHVSLNRQAAEVDRNRILQTAWTNWNDALRCKALAQRIDERILAESLYRWVLQERLRLFQRTINARLLRRATEWWHAKAQEGVDRLVNAEVVFAERQRRRRLAFGMIRLNIAMRHREDCERAAVEFVNSRTLPKVLDVWKENANHVSRLQEMAGDARFYRLCTFTLKVWREKTTEHKHQRKRDAYARIRARIKIRIVGSCFVRWRTRAMEVHSLEGEAERRAQNRIVDVGIRAFHRWRQETARCEEMSLQAATLDRQKLLSSAVSAITGAYGDLARAEQQAVDFKRETDIAILGGAFKRIQWATFTAARKSESADALWARNRDQHVKQMLRHWASQTALRRAAEERGPANDEQESPSLRPASRAASRAADVVLPSSPPLHTSTPGYMRTPSRPKRAGRFRPLPTPAMGTPMAFDSVLLATTTPGPLPAVEQDKSFVSPSPRVTPFERKLRAGGYTPGPAPPSALRSSGFRRSNGVVGGTNKSVRFAGATRFRSRGDESHEKAS